MFDGKIGFAPGSSGRRFIFSDNSTNHFCEIDSAKKFGGYQASVDLVLNADTMYRARMSILADVTRYDIIDSGIHTASTSRQHAGAYGNLYLFRIDNQYAGSGHRIGRCKIYVNDEVIRDFLPVMKNGVACMYEQIEETFYANAGSGDFIAGPRKS